MVVAGAQSALGKLLGFPLQGPWLRPALSASLLHDFSMPGDYLDLSSEPEERSLERNVAPSAHEPGSERSGGRRFVGIHFACCDVYSRVYINRQETAYVGHCPRCMRRVELRIGPGGTDARFFTAF
jgi:hypothetical protein